MTTTTKRKTRPIKHTCVQSDVLKRHTEVLDRLSKLTIGNGTPEDGLLFKFNKFLTDHDIVINDIKEIKTKLSTVNEINTEMEIQRRVKEEKEKLLKELKDSEIHNTEKKKFSWAKASVIVAALAFIVMAIFQTLNYFDGRDTKEIVTATENKVDDLGSPVVTNPRGEFVPLPEGFSLKMWPRDFDTIDTIK